MVEPQVVPAQDIGHRAVEMHNRVRGNGRGCWANPLAGAAGANDALWVLTWALAQIPGEMPELVEVGSKGGLSGLRVLFRGHRHPSEGIGTLVVGLRLSDDELTASAYSEFIPRSLRICRRLRGKHRGLGMAAIDPTRVSTANPCGIAMYFPDCWYPPVFYQSSTQIGRARAAAKQLAKRLKDHYGLYSLG